MHISHSRIAQFGSAFYTPDTCDKNNINIKESKIEAMIRRPNSQTRQFDKVQEYEEDLHNQLKVKRLRCRLFFKRSEV